MYTMLKCIVKISAVRHLLYGERHLVLFEVFEGFRRYQTTRQADRNSDIIRRRHGKTDIVSSDGRRAFRPFAHRDEIKYVQ